MVKTKRRLAQEENERFWQDHVRNWRKEEVSQVEYCRKHNLSRDKFFYWKRKLISTGSPSISLVPVPMVLNAQPIPKPLVVVVADRFRIEVNGDFESAVLGKLVHTLEGM